MINSQLIKQARIDRGLNINEVVLQTQVSRVSIYRLEKGITKNPQAKILKKLAILYGKDTSYFYTRGSLKVERD
jgi:transcriptional regulator with XRE-family HTH domain